MTHEAFNRAAKAVRQGGVIAYPAEACFGLGCAPDNLEGIERIRTMKSRLPEQGFILVADSLEHLLPYILWDALEAAQQRAVQASWPGPVTWLIPASDRAGPALTGAHETLAVRVSAFDAIRELCTAAEAPLVSTSANRRGQDPLTTAAEVAAVFTDEIDYIIDLPIQGLDNPSRIIDARTQQTLRAS